MTIRALIVDDEAPARERLVALLAAEPDVDVVASCANGPDAVDAIAEARPGLVFLDIQMPQMSGFEVLDAVGADAIPALVFVTAWDHFTLRAFDARAIDYLLKPFTEARFADALRRARRLLSGDAARELHERVVAGLVRDSLPPPRERRIAVRHEGRVLFLRPPDIDWIEGAGNYVQLHAGGAVYPMRATLRRVAERLRDAGFRRIHHSCIVNLDRVRSIERLARGDYRVRLDDGTMLETSRSYAANLDPLR